MIKKQLNLNIACYSARKYKGLNVDNNKSDFSIKSLSAYRYKIKKDNNK